VEGEGPVQDRTQEHLSSTDKAIILMRKLLLRAVQEVQEGKEAPHVVRAPSANGFPQLVVLSEEIPSAADHRAHVRARVDERREQADAQPALKV